MSAVMKTPVSTPVKRFFVMAVKIDLNLFPAAFCSPSLMVFIPKRNNPSEPTSIMKS
jgi:hypothetical protein